MKVEFQASVVAINFFRLSGDTMKLEVRIRFGTGKKWYYKWVQI